LPTEAAASGYPASPSASASSILFQIGGLQSWAPRSKWAVMLAHWGRQGASWFISLGSLKGRGVPYCAARLPSSGGPVPPVAHLVEDSGWKQRVRRLHSGRRVALVPPGVALARPTQPPESRGRGTDRHASPCSACACPTPSR